MSTDPDRAAPDSYPDGIAPPDRCPHGRAEGGCPHCLVGVLGRAGILAGTHAGATPEGVRELRPGDVVTLVDGLRGHFVGAGPGPADVHFIQPWNAPVVGGRDEGSWGTWTNGADATVMNSWGPARNDAGRDTDFMERTREGNRATAHRDAAVSIVVLGKPDPHMQDDTSRVLSVPKDWETIRFHAPDGEVYAELPMALLLDPPEFFRLMMRAAGEGDGAMAGTADYLMERFDGPGRRPVGVEVLSPVATAPGEHLVITNPDGGTP